MSLARVDDVGLSALVCLVHDAVHRHEPDDHREAVLEGQREVADEAACAADQQVVRVPLERSPSNEISRRQPHHLDLPQSRAGPRAFHGQRCPPPPTFRMSRNSSRIVEQGREVAPDRL